MARVAVIGGGPSGLVTMKTLLQHGFAAKCFETDATFGGIWNYKKAELSHPGYAGEIKGMSHPIYKSLTTNTGIYNTAFSDFPPEKLFGENTHQAVLKYLCRYANHFKLEPHIQCNSNVLKLNKDNNKWIVYYEYNDKPRDEAFDKVIIASGVFRYPNVPSFPNEDQFKGVCIHSSQVRDEAELFGNKRVLFLGGGYSGSDLTSLALNRAAKHVSIIPTTHYPNKNVWTWNRRGRIFDNNGSITNNILEEANLEWDYQMTYQNCVENDNFYNILKSGTFNIFREKRTNNEPNFSTDIKGITDSIAFLDHEIEQNRLSVHKSPVASFSTDGVTLQDGTAIDDVDVVVKATGYIHSFPFLNHLQDNETQHKCELYKCMLPTDKSMDGLAFVSIQKSLVALPMAEMNARWLCRKFAPKQYISKKGSLYSNAERDAMIAKVDEKRRGLAEGASMTYTKYPAIHVEELASELDCATPDYKRLLRSSHVEDVELGVALYHGPFIGTRYRLQGFGSTSSARHELINFARAVMGKNFDYFVNEYKQEIRRE